MKIAHTYTYIVTKKGKKQKEEKVEENLQPAPYTKSKGILENVPFEI